MPPITCRDGRDVAKSAVTNYDLFLLGKQQIFNRFAESQLLLPDILFSQMKEIARQRARLAKGTAWISTIHLANVRDNKHSIRIA